MAFLIQLVQIAFRVLEILLLIRIFLSWIPHDPCQPILRFIYEVTEPILAPFRRFLTVGPFDFSPILAFIVLGLVERLVIQILVLI